MNKKGSKKRVPKNRGSKKTGAPKKQGLQKNRGSQKAGSSKESGGLVQRKRRAGPKKGEGSSKER